MYALHTYWMMLSFSNAVWHYVLCDRSMVLYSVLTEVCCVNRSMELCVVLTAVWHYVLR